MRTELNLRPGVLITLIILCGAVDSGPCLAQASMIADGVADTSSPRATLRSLIEACNTVDQLVKQRGFFERSRTNVEPLAAVVIDCIDTREIPSFAANDRSVEVAICIKEIIDRHELPPWDEIPDVAAIEQAGGFENLSVWRIPSTRLTISRVEDGDRKHEYLFSTGTVNRAVNYYHSIASKPYRETGPKTSPGLYNWYLSAPGHPTIAQWVNQLPDRLRFGRTFGLTNWKWPGLLLSLFVAVVLIILCYWAYFTYAARAQARSVLAGWLMLALPIAAMSVPYLFVLFSELYLVVRGAALYVIGFLSTVVLTMSAIFIVFALGNRIAETVIASPRINPQGLNAQLIRIASKLTSTVLGVAVFLFGGQFLGIPVATLLASAGIGGIALALGAQDTLKTLFGTIMLMADKPFRVGERVVFKGYDGIVEDIGLRSTRIRLLNSHQVSVPNDQLAGSDIENVGRRDCIRRAFDIHIPNDTPFEKLEQAVSLVRDRLDQHEGMREDFPPRVYFVDFLPDAFTINVIYWYHPANYWDYLAFSEEFNFAICRDFTRHGIQFSLPQRVTHTSLDSDAAPVDVRVIDQK